MSESNQKLEAIKLAEKCVAVMTEKDHCTKKMGMDIVHIDLDKVVVVMKVREDMLNGFEICHGGQIFTLADSTFAFSCNITNEVTVASGGDIHYLNPARLGDVLTATSKKVHTSGRLGVYDVEVNNQDDLPIARFRGRSYTVKGKPLIKEER